MVLYDKEYKGERKKYFVNIIFPDVVVEIWGRKWEKAYVCMTDKGWIALNLSRKKTEAALNGFSWALAVHPRIQKDG